MVALVSIRTAKYDDTSFFNELGKYAEKTLWFEFHNTDAARRLVKAEDGMQSVLASRTKLTAKSIRLSS